MTPDKPQVWVVFKADGEDWIVESIHKTQRGAEHARAVAEEQNSFFTWHVDYYDLDE